MTTGVNEEFHRVFQDTITTTLYMIESEGEANQNYPYKAQMDRSLVLTCRGCTGVIIDDPVSLLDFGVRHLYEECTHLSVCLYSENEMDI